MLLFLFFADHHVDLGKLVREGRQESLRQFRSLAGPDVEEYFADPGDLQTFECSKLDWSEGDRHTEVLLAMHRDLLRLRRDDPVFSTQRGCLSAQCSGPRHSSCDSSATPATTAC